MKVEVNSKETKKLEFPCIMISEGGVIIIATSPPKAGWLKGTVIGKTGSASKKYEIGEYVDNWLKGGFKLFKGTVTLSNS